MIKKSCQASFPPGVFTARPCRDDKCLDAEQTLTVCFVKPTRRHGRRDAGNYFEIFAVRPGCSRHSLGSLYTTKYKTSDA